MQKKAPLLWINFSVLSLTFLAAITIVPLYGFKVGYTGWEWGLFFFYMWATGMSITAGYHRLWSHRTYQAHWLPRLFFAIFGAASLQNSILHWSADHRVHHRHVDDNDRDPYSAKKGFWHSHIGWIIRRFPAGEHDIDKLTDLKKDKIVMWQHKYYVPIAVVTNAVVPLLIGYMSGRLWGAFLLAGILRIVLNHHFTFFINSLAHMWGSQPFGTENSARDNGFLALFTYGEGYHNFHHRFQSDYRNGIRWYQYDPSKWLINSLSWMKLAWNRKTIATPLIIKAQVLAEQQKRMERSPKAVAPNPEWKQNLEAKYNQMIHALEAWTEAHMQWKRETKDKLMAKRREMQDKIDQMALKQKAAELKDSFKQARRQWRKTFRQVQLNPA